MLPEIGTLSSLQAGGRQGLVVAARPLGQPLAGQQLVALRIKTIDGRDAAGQASERMSGLGLPPTETGERGASGRALRTPDGERGARRDGPRAARLPSALSTAEKAVVAELRQRDAQVRQEETTHAALAGDLAGPIEYVYQQGPDGRPYAVGGSVGIRAALTSGDPTELARLGSRLRAAATAPINPSAQDYAVARLAYAAGRVREEPPPAHRGIDRVV